jgi:hypothetical protein
VPPIPLSSRRLKGFAFVPPLMSNVERQQSGKAKGRYQSEALVQPGRAAGGNAAGAAERQLLIASYAEFAVSDRQEPERQGSLALGVVC